MFRYVLTIIILSLFSLNIFAQGLWNSPCGKGSSCRKNTLYHATNSNFNELNYNSINFEHLLYCAPTNNLGWSIGAIYYNFSKIEAQGLHSALNLMFGRGSDFLEMGFGITYLNISKNYDDEIQQVYDDNLSYSGLNLNIGYRHQNADGGLFFKLAVNPMISLLNHEKIPVIDNQRFVPMGQVSIGWTFK